MQVLLVKNHITRDSDKSQLTLNESKGLGIVVHTVVQNPKKDRSNQTLQTTISKLPSDVVIVIVFFDAKERIGATWRLLNSAIDTPLVNKNNFNCNGCVFNKMEVIETIVIQNPEVEGKETVVSSVDSDKTKTEFIWTVQATWHLVNTRLEMDQAFDQPVCKKKKLWEMVAEKVNAKLRESEVTDVTVKAYECDLKWRNMLATYRKNTERAKRLGVTSIHWEFFKAMHDVLGKSREEIEAQRRAKLSGTRVGRAIASKRFTPILPTPPVTAAPCPSRPPQDVLQLYMELQERKMNMWAQQKALEERKIEAINNLAQAISSLAQKNSAQTPKDGH